MRGIACCRTHSINVVHVVAAAEIENTVEEDAVSGLSGATLLVVSARKQRFVATSGDCNHVHAMWGCGALPPATNVPPSRWATTRLQMDKMEKSLESVKRSLQTVRTGRATPTMLDRYSRQRPACTCGHIHEPA